MRKKSIPHSLLSLLLVSIILIGMVPEGVVASEGEVIASFAVPVTQMSVETGTKKADIPLPATLEATLEGGKSIDIPVNWDDDGLYDKNTAGVYTFTADYGVSYVYAGAAPYAAVTVKVAETEQAPEPEPEPEPETAPDPVPNPEPAIYANAIGGIIWIDKNKNGAMDEGEPRAVGYEVLLLTEMGDLDSAVMNTTTVADGAYTFSNILPGSYVVAVKTNEMTGPANDLGENQMSSYMEVTTAAFSQALSVGEDGRITGIHGGLIPAAQWVDDYNNSIGGIVWLDGNGDGVMDDEEARLPGYAVKLVSANEIKTTSTNQSGEYVFKGLAPGEWRVQIAATNEALLPSAILNGNGIGADGQSEAFVVDENTGATLNAGLLPNTVNHENASSISGFVWIDVNNDGVYNPEPEQPEGALDEEGVPVDGAYVKPELPLIGWKVFLVRADDVNAIVATVETDDQGNYAFTDVEQGAYKVKPFENEIYTASSIGMAGVNSAANTDGTTDVLMVLEDGIMNRVDIAMSMTPPMAMAANDAVKIRGAETTYPTIRDAVVAATSPAVIEVFGNVTETADVEIGNKHITLVAVGGSFTATMGPKRFTVANGGRLTIGEGSNGNTITIQGDDASDRSMVFVSNGFVQVNDGARLMSLGIPLMLSSATASGRITGGHLENTGYPDSISSMAVMLEEGAAMEEIGGATLLGMASALGLFTQSKIHRITGGTFSNTAGSTPRAAVNVDNQSEIGEISGGTFTGKADSALLVIRGAKIGKISGGTFTAKSYGLNIYSDNSPTGIDEISGGSFSGLLGAWIYGGSPNAPAHISKISGGSFRGEGANSRGLQLDLYSTVMTIHNAEIVSSSDGRGLFNAGYINEIGSGTVITGQKNGVLNHYLGSGIETISGGRITATNVGSAAIINETSIGEISGGTFIGEGYAMDSTLRATAPTTSADPTLSVISGGAFYGKSETLPAIRLTTQVSLEPDLTANKGAGRYWGGQGVIFENEDLVAYPAGYRMSTRTEAVSDIPSQGFRFLEKVVKLTISKTTTGEYLSPKQPFSFTVYFADETGSPLASGTQFSYKGGTIASSATAPSDGVLTLDSEGKARFTLSSGQSISVEVAGGTKVRVVEDVTGAYTVSFVDKDGSCTGPIQSNDTTLLSITANRVFDFINTSTIVPTGVDTGSLEGTFLLLMMLLAMAGGLTALSRRRRSGEGC